MSKVSSECRTESYVSKLISRSDIESVARCRTEVEKASHFRAGVWGPGAAPPISMTSWLPRGASGAPFEALPRKPHPLEKGVKNTELEIASARPRAGAGRAGPLHHHDRRCDRKAASWEGPAGPGRRPRPRQAGGLRSPRREAPPPPQPSPKIKPLSPSVTPLLYAGQAL